MVDSSVEVQPIRVVEVGPSKKMYLKKFYG